VRLDASGRGAPGDIWLGAGVPRGDIAAGVSCSEVWGAVGGGLSEKEPASAGVGPAGVTAVVDSAPSWGGDVGSSAVVVLPTGRIAARRLPSAVSCSLPEAVAGCLRGVNQPSPPPEVPLSAGVVVGASMVCLASNIFRSVCALPRSEGACFPRDGLHSPFVATTNTATFNQYSHPVRTSKVRV
jgi:hypothetical protein